MAGPPESEFPIYLVHHGSAQNSLFARLAQCSARTSRGGLYITVMITHVSQASVLWFFGFRVAVCNPLLFNGQRIISANGQNGTGIAFAMSQYRVAFACRARHTEVPRTTNFEVSAHVVQRRNDRPLHTVRMDPGNARGMRTHRTLSQPAVPHGDVRPSGCWQGHPAQHAPAHPGSLSPFPRATSSAPRATFPKTGSARPYGMPFSMFAVANWRPMKR